MLCFCQFCTDSRVSFGVMDDCACIWCKPFRASLPLGVLGGVRGSGFKSDIIYMHKEAFSLHVNFKSYWTHDATCTLKTLLV